MTKQTHPSTQNGIQIPYKTTYDELCKNLNTPGPLAWASCTALGYMGSEIAIRKLIELAQSPDWRFRRSAIEAMVHHPQACSSITTIQQALHDNSPYVVRTACRAAAKLDMIAVHSDVLMLIKSSDPSTRLEAIDAISYLWEANDFDELYRLFQLEKIEKVRKSIAWALRAHVTEGNWRKLFDSWWQDPLHRHRKWACELASQFGISEIKNEIGQLSHDKDGHVRKAAIEAISSS